MQILAHLDEELASVQHHGHGAVNSAQGGGLELIEGYRDMRAADILMEG